MKQKDIALVIVVGIVALIFGTFISNALFNSASNKTLKADTVTAISTEFKEPDKKYFNAESIDPTQIIRIGENANDKPFDQ